MHNTGPVLAGKMRPCYNQKRTGWLLFPAFEREESVHMQPQIDASVSYGTKEHLPEIYALMKQQFPPSECYGYENMAALLEGGRYRLLRYCRQEDGALIGYAWCMFPRKYRLHGWITSQCSLNFKQRESAGNCLLHCAKNFLLFAGGCCFP